jgi:hypothetical protein
VLLIFDCDRPEPGDPRFPEALARVNAFADECRRRGAFVAAHPLRGGHTATTVAVREGKTVVTDGPFLETHEHLGGAYVSTAATSTRPWNWPRCARRPRTAPSRSGRSPACRA